MLEVRDKRIPGEAAFLTFIMIICLGAQARSNAGSDSAQLTLTNRYVFIPAQSTLHQTGGIASVDWTYTVGGQFILKVDFDTGTASFIEIDANAVDDSVYKRTRDPNNVFAMTSLVGVVHDNSTIEFTGQTSDRSSVSLTATLEGNLAHLIAGTVPPPDSADYFIYTLDALGQRKYAGGTGEPNEPYKIAGAEDLIKLGETPDDYDMCFMMTEDVNLAPTLPGRKVFDAAIIAPDMNDIESGFQGKPFTGVFDGNRHDIFNMTISGSSYLGLFGQSDYNAELKNIDVIDANIIGAGDYIGTLTGYNRGTITSSYGSGRLSGNKRIGGLAGRNFGTIEASCTAASVAGYDVVGGITADNYGLITMSYSTGSVSANYDAGGLVCTNYADVNETYSACTVAGGRLAGGLVASNWQDASVASSFWDSNTSGQTASDGGIGKTKLEMETRSTFTSSGWDFVGETANGRDGIWWILDGRDYPRLWWQLPRDNFSDGKPEPLWLKYEMDPESAWLEEVHGRLEANTSGAMEDVDAIYAPDGWALDANKPFAVQVDFHFSKIGVGDGRIHIGLVPSLDPYAMKWAEFEVGTFDENPFFLYEIRDGLWVREEVDDRFTEDGTLYVSYDPNSDELYLSDIGCGKRQATWTIADLIRGRWQTDSVYVILSGGSEGGLVLTGDDAWLDNFNVVQGTIRQ